MSEKKRINQIAKESGLTNKELVDHAQQIGLPVKSHSSSIDAEQAKQLLSSLKLPVMVAAKHKLIRLRRKQLQNPKLRTV